MIDDPDNPEWTEADFARAKITEKGQSLVEMEGLAPSPQTQSVTRADAKSGRPHNP